MEKEAVFGIVQRRNSLKFRYLRVTYSYALRGVSYGITSNDFGNPKSDTGCRFSGENPLKPH